MSNTIPLTGAPGLAVIATTIISFLSTSVFYGLLKVEERGDTKHIGLFSFNVAFFVSILGLIVSAYNGWLNGVSFALFWLILGGLFILSASSWYFFNLKRQSSEEKTSKKTRIGILTAQILAFVTTIGILVHQAGGFAKIMELAKKKQT